MQEPTLGDLMNEFGDSLNKLNSSLRKQRREECNCEVEIDPHGTGDTWYRVKNCRNPDNCPGG